MLQKPEGSKSTPALRWPTPSEFMKFPMSNILPDNRPVVVNPATHKIIKINEQTYFMAKPVAQMAAIDRHIIGYGKC
ncbi:hypothetical protein FJ970_16410 [Mesorhizobium sp. B2-1-8]|uniref:hypothetical protein n=1 Tax=unclassified Mesorhizobium TaxID=325217 RepID=UPI001129651D|nr:MULTISPECIES: hypothetical protein [unclassified Mesorhizobium]TPI25764.1 hypothetical protein FJW08_27655 [Mesorhizobium sp. B3-2-1]UCI16754.1 hypothetical protein FJ970_16410 [Mesorhizobium sp. B2-1-8]